MPDIISTVGSGSANSFATEDEFSDYCDARLNSSAYTDASSDDRVRALIEATRELTLLEYKGERVDATQSLSWPRNYCEDPDAPWVLLATGYTASYIDATIIPERVKNATCELALQFLASGTTDLASIDSSISIKSETVGPISTTYADPYERAQGLARFPRVLNYVRPLLSSKSGGLDLVRM